MNNSALRIIKVVTPLSALHVPLLIPGARYSGLVQYIGMDMYSFDAMRRQVVLQMKNW